jgi:hypothetical protein
MVGKTLGEHWKGPPKKHSFETMRMPKKTSWMVEYYYFNK